jgi:uncharacterized membrane protein
MSIQDTFTDQPVSTVQPRDNKSNMHPIERVASVAAGGALVITGLKRRPLSRTALLALGGGLLYRGITGRSRMYEILNFDSRDLRLPGGDQFDGKQVEMRGDIIINKSPRDLYRLWKSTAGLTSIIKPLADIAPAGDGRLRWRLPLSLGTAMEWETHTVESHSGSLVRWATVGDSGFQQEGQIQFHPAENNNTKVTLQVSNQIPGGVVGQAAAKLLESMPSNIANSILQRFKDLAETGKPPASSTDPFP